VIDERIPEAANAFGLVAADYERARPTYPVEAIELLRRELRLAPGCVVCDLAAGTGKLTRLLIGSGATVVAVEPVAGMRAQLSEVLPDIDVRDGTAEALPFDDASLDAVTVAQAFHWFRFDDALTEIRRVLRPGGALAIVFNERDERTPWVKTWNDTIEWHGRRIAMYQSTDWASLLAGHGLEGGGQAHIEWVQPLTRDLLAARVRSVSYIAEETAEVQQSYVDRVLALVQGRDEPFDLPYVTHLWWARRPA